MTDYRYLPTVNSLLPNDRLDSVKLGVLREAFEPLLEHLFYKDIFVAGTPSGSAAHYDLTLVWYKRLALEVPGTDGLALVAFPAQDGGAGMELPIAFEYRWEILRYKPYFDGTIPADPKGWFDLLMEILGVDPQSLLLETVAILVEGEEPLQTFIETSGKGLLTLSDDPDADVLADLMQQIEALDLDLTQIIFEDYIEPAVDKLERITALFRTWLGAIEPSDLLALVVPQFELELRRIQFALTFPRSWLKPLDEDGNVITDPTHRSALYFDVGKFRFSSRDGLSFHQQGNFNFPKSVILDTGFTLSLQDALVDIDQASNIAPADADGRPLEFIGFYAKDAAIGLPPDWFEDPNGTTAELFGADVLVGTGGVSGTFGIRAAATGVDDPVLNFCLGGAGGIAIGLRHFDMRLQQNTIELAELNGQISIPGVVDHTGSPAALDMTATLDNKGTLHITTTGQMYLGNGIWLYPSDSQPIMSATIEKGASTTYAFDINALFKAPHADGGDGTKEIQVSGALELKTGASGSLEIHEFHALSEAAGFDWTLPGNIQLRQAGVSVRYSSSTHAFQAHLHGRFSPDQGHGMVDIEAGLAFNDLHDPTNIEINTRLDIEDLAIPDQAHVFDATLVLEVTTKPLFGKLQIISGTAGLFPTDQQPASVSDFCLAITDLSAQLSFDPQGFDLIFETGALQLPENFGPDPDNPYSPRPAVSLSQSNPLQLSYRAPDQVRFQGQFTFTDFGTTLPGTDDQSGIVIKLQTAILKFTDHSLPQLTQVDGFIRLPLPDNKSADVVFEDFAWALIDIPTGIIYLKDDIPLPLGGGFELRILGSGNPTDIATGLTIAKDNGQPVFLIDGAVELVIPVDMLTKEDGDQIYIGSSGNISWRPNEIPVATLEELHIGGSFRLGGADGIIIREGELGAAGINNMLRPTEMNPFQLILSGKVYLGDDGPGAGIKGATFSFTGEEFPLFDFQGFYVKPGEEILGTLEQLPLKLRELEVTFIEPDPLPARLDPTNIRVTLSAELSLPLPSGGNLIGMVDDISVHFNKQGLPIRKDGSPGIDIGGIGMGIDEFEAGGILLTGIVYLGGLDDPDDLFFAGKVGGKFNGSGVSALLALGPKGPRGLCLEVSGGSAGITLPYGFVLSGAEGGLIFPNLDGRVSNADPCDIRTYIRLNDDGKPERTDQPAVSKPEVSADEQVIQQPAGEAVSENPEFECPQGDCPPPAVSIISQPHPDRRKYPDRVIVKFTAIDESMLHQLGITPTFFDQLGLTTPDEIAEATVGNLFNLVESNFPDPAALPVPPETRKEVLSLTNKMKSDTRNLLVRTFSDGIELALHGNDSVYEAVKELAYAGIPSPETTFKLTGTFSYTGVSAFLSITGGFSISTVMIPQPVPLISTVGILGSINLLGIPMGTARLFLNTTDASGTPLALPTICGDVYAGLGPVEFGQMRMKFQAEGLTEGLANAGITFAQHLSGPLVHEVVQLVAAEVLDHPDYDPNQPAGVFALMSFEQITAFTGDLLNLPPERITPDIQACFVELMNNAWESFSPKFFLCGQVQPKLFGLGLGTELADAKINITKTALAAQFGISPSFILSYYFGNIFPAIDKASVGLAFDLPDPIDLINTMLTTDMGSLQQLNTYLQAGFEHVLENAVYTLEYELIPMGLKMADAEARFIMPDLLDHPAHPNSSWMRPEDRTDRDYLSRLQLLLRALEVNVLANPLWKGTAEDLDTLTGDATQGLSLKQYFPHGGLLGAAKLSLPLVLLDGIPPKLMAELISSDSDLFKRFNLAKNILENYILKTENIGELAFYVPFPNPPTFTIDGQDPTPMQLVKKMQDDGFDLSDIGAGDLLSVEQAFFKGQIQNARVLGIPVYDARVTAYGPDAATNSAGRFEICAGVPAQSWLSQFVDRAELNYTLSQAPARPVDEYFRELLALMQSDRNSSGMRVVGTTPLENLPALFAENLPKMVMEAHLNRLRIPDALAGFIRVRANTSLVIKAYSPFYNPAAVGNHMDAQLQRNGGIYFAFQCRFGIPNVFEVDIPNARFALLPFSDTSVLPKLIGEFTANRIDIPFGLPAMEQTKIYFNSTPQGRENFAELKGKMSHIPLGLLNLVPIQGSRLSAKLVVSRVNTAGRFDFQLSPLKLQESGFIRSDLTIVGGGSNQPLTLKSTGTWKAAARGRRLALFAGQAEVLRVGSNFVLSGSMTGKGFSSVQMQLSLPFNIQLTAFPNHPILEKKLSLPSRGHANLSINSNGAFSIQAAVSSFNFGLIQISGTNSSALSVALSNQGFELPSGAKLHIRGLTQTPFILKQFIIGANARFAAAASGGKMGVAQFFEMSGGNLLINRTQTNISIAVNGPSFYLFPATVFSNKLSIGKFLIDSNGYFQINSANQIIRLLGLVEAKGSFLFSRSRSGISGKLNSAEFKILPLGLSVKGNASIGNNTVKAFLEAKAYKVTGLIEISPASWQFDWQKQSSFRLKAISPSLKILNKSLMPKGQLLLVGRSDTSFLLNFNTNSNLIILPGLMAVGPASVAFTKSKTAVYDLKMNGQVKALKNPANGQWILNQSTAVNLTNGNFKKEITALRSKTFVDVGLAKVYSNNRSRVYFGRNNRAYYFEFSKLKLKVMGLENDVSGSCNSSGSLNLKWNTAKELPIGPFRLSNRGAEVSMNLKNRSFSVKIPAGQLKAPNVAGFPSAGINIPQINIGTNGDFAANLSAFTFNGIGLSVSKSSNTIKLHGKDKKIRIRNKKTLWGASADLSLDINANASVTGSITGAFKLSDISVGSIKFSTINVGRVTLGYKSSRPGYQFEGSITLNNVSGKKKKTTRQTKNVWNILKGIMEKVTETVVSWVAQTFKIRVTLKYGSAGSKVEVKVL
jgi:hypothetical protein